MLLGSLAANVSREQVFRIRWSPLCASRSIGRDTAELRSVLSYGLDGTHTRGLSVLVISRQGLLRRQRHDDHETDAKQNFSINKGYVGCWGNTRAIGSRHAKPQLRRRPLRPDQYHWRRFLCLKPHPKKHSRTLKKHHHKLISCLRSVGSPSILTLGET